LFVGLGEIIVCPKKKKILRRGREKREESDA
jgi:hypothetical protein